MAKSGRLQIIFSILILAAIAALAVFENRLTSWQYSQIKPAPIKQRYLGPCLDCHIEKQPDPRCGGLTHQEWAVCTDKFYAAGEAP